MKNELKKYLKLLEKGFSSLDNDLLFKEILKKSENVLRLSDSDLASEMQMNKSTVTHWRTGKTTPYPIMRKGIYTWLKKRTTLMLKK